MTNDNFVGLDAYAKEGGQGFGAGSMGEIGELQKALEAGHVTGRDTTDSLSDSGAPLKVESLERSLKILEYKMSDIVLWNNFPKLTAYNTVEEFNRLVSYGADRGGFNQEGELPVEEDSIYQRKAELVKFLGTTRSVSHVMSLVNTTVGNVVQRETQNGMMWLLRKLDRSLVSGNANTVPVEFNGLYAQHQSEYSTPAAYYDESGLVIDLRGATLAEASIEEGVRTIVDNFGTANMLFAPPIVLSNFVKTFYSNLRQYAPVGNDSTVGRRVTTFQSQFGEIGLNFDKFMNRGRNITSATAATSNRAPSPVTDGAAPLAAAADTAGTKFVAGDAGDYYYAVTAINRYGESTPKVLGAPAAVTLAANQSVDLQFVDGGGTDAATGYKIYRSAKDATYVAGSTEFSPLFEISVAELDAGYDDAAATKVRDRNRILPNTDQAFLIEKSDDIYAYKQLAPIMKMQLALVNPAIRFMILSYGTPILYQPKKMVRFINIGTA